MISGAAKYTVSLTHPTEKSSPKAKRALKAQGSILDLVREDSKDLLKNSSRDDKLKIDEYLTSVRETEMKIQQQLSPPKGSWAPKGKINFPAPSVNPPDEHDVHLRQMVDLMRSEERRVGKECRSRWSPYP